MSFHFCAHSWEVQYRRDGVQVKLAPRDLDGETVPVLVDELFDLSQENGLPNLYLDFSDIHQISSLVLGKLVSLNGRLTGQGGRLTILNVRPLPYEVFEATSLTEVLDVRAADSGDTLF